MRTATTAVSVWCACQTCATHSFSPAGTFVSAMRVLTHYVTKPTTALSADCVSISLINAYAWLIFGTGLVMFSCMMRHFRQKSDRVLNGSFFVLSVFILIGCGCKWLLMCAEQLVLKHTDTCWTVIVILLGEKDFLFIPSETYSTHYYRARKMFMLDLTSSSGYSGVHSVMWVKCKQL